MAQRKKASADAGRLNDIAESSAYRPLESTIGLDSGPSTSSVFGRIVLPSEMAVSANRRDEGRDSFVGIDSPAKGSRMGREANKPSGDPGELG